MGGPSGHPPTRDCRLRLVSPVSFLSRFALEACLLFICSHTSLFRDFTHPEHRVDIPCLAAVAWDGPRPWGEGACFSLPAPPASAASVPTRFLCLLHRWGAREDCGCVYMIQVTLVAADQKSVMARFNSQPDPIPQWNDAEYQQVLLASPASEACFALARCYDDSGCGPLRGLQQEEVVQRLSGGGRDTLLPWGFTVGLL